MDLNKIKEMIALMEEHDLTEIEISNGQEQIRLKKGEINGMVQVIEFDVP